MKRLVLAALLGSLSIAATAETNSTNTFTAGRSQRECTRNVSDAKTKEDVEFVEQICTGYLRGLTDALL